MSSISNIDIGATNITTLGTITTGTWSATGIGLAYGGLGADLTASLSAGGLLYSTASAGAILAGAGSANLPLASGASSAPTWATATYPGTTTIGLLYASSANVIGKISSAAGGMMTSNTTQPIGLAMGNGRIPVYSVAASKLAAPVITTTVGKAVVVINGAGTVTLSMPAIVNQASGTVTAVSQNMYFINNGASLVTVTLPAEAADVVIYVIGGSSGGWKVAQLASQLIRLPGGVVTTTGTGGSISSNNQYDCIKIRGSETANQYIAEWISGRVIYV